MTRTEEIHHQIAEAIVRGRLAPGTQLEEVELARQFGVSRTPVREAIRQLEAEGFAKARPRRGAVVATIPPERLAEMFFVMAELEALCAQLAAIGRTSEQMAALELVHAACAAAEGADDIQGYRAANDQFHALIYEASHNLYLRDLTQSVRRRVAPFRGVQFYSSGRLARSLAEHERIMQALRRQDGAAAAAEMRAHIVIVEQVYETAFGLESTPAAVRPVTQRMAGPVPATPK